MTDSWLSLSLPAPTCTMDGECVCVGRGNGREGKGRRSPHAALGRLAGYFGQTTFVPSLHHAGLPSVSIASIVVAILLCNLVLAGNSTFLVQNQKLYTSPGALK